METIESVKRLMLLVLVCLVISLAVVKTQNENVSETVVSSNEAVRKTVYLTFDDGPSENTERVLDVLNEYGIKASFFLIGNQIDENNYEIVERIRDEGHAIGLHCSCHNYNKLYSGEYTCMESILEEKKMLEESFGICSTMYRLPGGSTNIYITDKDKIISGLREEGLRGFDWNVSAEDSVGIPTEESIMNNIFKDVERVSEPVILLHDGIGNSLTAETLPQILERLINSGYVFETLEFHEEMLFDV